MRVLGSLLFMLYHLGRIAIVIYLPILAITSVSSINPILIALFVGGLCIIYAFLGGIEGVIWTDVIQGFLLLGGALLIIFIGAYYIKGGFGTIAHDVAVHHKLYSKANWDPHNLKLFIPLIFAGSVFNSLYQYTGSQDVVQRYQTTSTMKETAKSLWTNGLLAFITIPIFYGMGTILYSFYLHSASLPKGFNTSAVVPYFVIKEVPAGLAGLIIAGIFAAAQSTIASSLNAISACAITDFKQRFFDKKFKRVSDVQLARIVILIAGILGLLMAIYLLVGNQSQTWNLFLAFTGLFGVPIAGIFAAGIFTQRANTVGAVTGLIVSAALTYYVQSKGMSPFMVSCVSFLSSMFIAWFVGLFTPQKKNIVGLTAKTVDQEYTRH